MEDFNIKYDGWEIVSKIGAGSFSTVYEIQRNILGEIEKAALKVISIPKDDSEIQELYRSGYDDASITEHFRDSLKNIIQEYIFMYEMKGYSNIVYCDDIKYVQKDSGIGWNIFIRMELLDPMLDRFSGPYDEKEVIRLGIDLSKALIACHSKNVVHRDIKPQNVFYSPKNGDYKLGDFGVAKVMEQTSGGTIIGTVNFMAPEVYNNQPYGSVSDIYSAGMILYILMNEKRFPFLPLPPVVPKYSDMEEARKRRFRGDPLPDPVHGSEGLKKIVLKACEADKDVRYQTAEEMLADFVKLLKESGSEDVLTEVNTARTLSGNTTSKKKKTDPGYYSNETTVISPIPVPVKQSNHKGLYALIAVVLCAALLGGFIFFINGKNNSVPSANHHVDLDSGSLYPQNYIFYWLQNDEGEYVLHDYEKLEKSDSSTLSINDADFYDKYKSEYFKFNSIDIEEERHVINVYYRRFNYTLKFYFAREYSYKGTDYIQVNNNNGSFSTYEGEDIETALTRFAQSDNDYQGGVAGGSVWRSVNVNSWQDLIEPQYLSNVKSEVQHGSTWCFTDWTEKPAELLEDVKFTYYYYEIKASYGENLMDVWPVRSIFRTVNRSDLNSSQFTGDSFTAVSWGTRYNTGYFNRLHSSDDSYASSNNYNINGTYGMLDETLFTEAEAQKDGGTACFLAYWGAGTINKYTYQAYYSSLKSDHSGTDVMKKDGNEYKLETVIYPVETTIGINSIEALPFEGVRYIENSRETDGTQARFYYQRNMHTIHYLSNIEPSDTVSDQKSVSIPDINNVPYGEKISLYDPDQYVIDETILTSSTGEKYIFKGWYKTPSWALNESPYDFKTSTEVMADEDLTFFARWDAVD